MDSQTFETVIYDVRQRHVWPLIFYTFAATSGYLISTYLIGLANSFFHHGSALVFIVSASQPSIQRSAFGRLLFLLIRYVPCVETGHPSYTSFSYVLLPPCVLLEEKKKFLVHKLAFTGFGFYDTFTLRRRTHLDEIAWHLQHPLGSMRRLLPYCWGVGG